MQANKDNVPGRSLFGGQSNIYDEAFLEIANDF